MRKEKVVYIVWASPRTRAKELSKKFNARLYGFFFSLPLPVVLRYLISTIKSLLILIREKPDYIIAQVPPIFLPFIVFFYSLFFGGKYLFDVHSGEIIDKKWRYFQPLRKFLFRRAFLILMHNSSNFKKIKNWKVNALVLNDPIPIPPDVKSEKLCNNCKEVVFISTFGIDEPFNESLEAANILKKENGNKWLFIFTGDYKSAKFLQKHKDIIFTGFVNYDKYWSILKGADVIVSLNKRKDVITCGLWEGVALEKPVVTNNYGCIEELFGDALIYTGNDAITIANAVRNAFLKRSIIKKKIKDRKIEIEKRWREVFSMILNSMEKK